MEAYEDPLDELYVPVAQAVHVEAPLEEKVQAAQGVQAVTDPPFEKVPAAQL